jgi:hypothetical protein
MPLEPEHISEFLESEYETKHILELLELLKERIDELCFRDCQTDRVACTLQPKCSRRFLLKLRLLSNLTIEDQPKFCYSVHKNVIQRDFRNKTVIYRPFDSYLYLIDFLDVFFHGDYRKLNKFLSKKDFKEVFKIFDDRINNRGEDFQYLITENQNYIILKFDDKIHIIFLNENYALCNANRDYIKNLEILNGLSELFASLYFPEVEKELIPGESVVLKTYFPKDVLKEISDKPPNNDESKRDSYLWNTFANDLDALSQFCKEINLYIDKKKNLKIKLHLGLKPLIRYRDLRLIFNIIFRLYNDFYIIWV